MNIENFKNQALSRKTQITERETFFRWVETQNWDIKDIRFGDDNPRSGNRKEPDLVVTLKSGKVIGVEIREVYKNQKQAEAYNKKENRTPDLESSAIDFGKAVKAAVEDKLTKHYDRGHLDSVILLIANRNWMISPTLLTPETVSSNNRGLSLNGTPIMGVTQAQEFTTDLKSEIIDEAFLVNFIGNLRSVKLHLNLL